MSDTDEEYDPFGAFDAANGVGQVLDPYPVLHELREECPVHVGPTWPRFGVDQPAEAMLIGDATPYTVMPFDAVQHVLRKNDVFSSSILSRIMGPIMGHTLLEMDEPDHQRNRALLQKAFSPKAVERWGTEIVEPVVSRHIDTFADRGRAELIRELFWPFPTHVIGEILGLPKADLPLFSRKAAELIGIIADVERGLAASQWLFDYFAEIIASRRRDPRDDIISVLVQAELNGEGLTDVEIVTFLRLLLPAGAETTYPRVEQSHVRAAVEPGPAGRSASRPQPRASRRRRRAAVGSTSHQQRSGRPLRHGDRGYVDPGRCTDHIEPWERQP